MVHGPYWNPLMRLAFVFLTTFAACTEFPALEGTLPPSHIGAAPPQLIPLSALLAQAAAYDHGGATAETDLAPRLSNLRARAARLRGPVISPPARSRMLRGVR